MYYVRRHTAGARVTHFTSSPRCLGLDIRNGHSYKNAIYFNVLVTLKRRFSYPVAGLPAGAGSDRLLGYRIR